MSFEPIEAHPLHLSLREVIPPRPYLSSIRPINLSSPVHLSKQTEAGRPPALPPSRRRRERRQTPARAVDSRNSGGFKTPLVRSLQLTGVIYETASDTGFSGSSRPLDRFNKTFVRSLKNVWSAPPSSFF